MRLLVVTHFRLIAAGAAALVLACAGTAFAEWPFGGGAVRMQPGIGGVCEECDLSGRILDGVRMTRAVFNRSDFSHAVLTRADASGSEFQGANFSDADLGLAKLVDTNCTRAQFTRATLVQADARGADFTRADFTRADVTRMNFDDATLSGADLRAARGLTQAQLRGACGDRHTRLPRGLRLQRCT